MADRACQAVSTASARRLCAAVKPLRGSLTSTERFGPLDGNPRVYLTQS